MLQWQVSTLLTYLLVFGATKVEEHVFTHMCHIYKPFCENDESNGIPTDPRWTVTQTIAELEQPVSFNC